jgi:MFS family permease
MNILDFLKTQKDFALSNKAILTLSLSHTFFSGMGQTFFISIFIPFFLIDFHLSRTEFSLIYAAATLSAAFSLPKLGALIDKIDLKKYSLSVGLLLSLASTLAALSFHWSFLALSLFLLRLSGQGLMSQISAVVIARSFASNRGKAMSITNLGYPLSELLIPALTTLFITPLGWRFGFIAMAILSITFFPWLNSLIFHKNPQLRQSQHQSEKAPQQIQASTSSVKSSMGFWLLIPASVTPPFLITAYFILQSFLGEHLIGWQFTHLAFALTFFALFRGIGSLAIGYFIDRYSARKLFNFYLIPLFIGTLSALFLPVWQAGILLFSGCGLTAGIGGNIKSSTLAELYGQKNLGSIRSLLATALISSTAISPLLGSYLLDLGVALESLFVACLILIASSVLFGYLGITNETKKYNLHSTL